MLLLERLVASGGLRGRVLQRVGHGGIVKITFLVIFLGKQGTDMAEDDPRCVILPSLKVRLTNLLKGGNALVGKRL